MDPRLKIVLCAAGSVASMVFSSPFSLALLIAGAFVLAKTATSLGNIGRVLAFVTAIMFISFGFTLLLSLFIPGIIKWDPLSLSVPYLRMLVVVFLLIWLALSTPVQAISGTLRSLRLPGFIFIPLSVAIRFIPSFMDDCAQIRDAARLRPPHSMTGVWRCIVVPLIFRVLSSADDLALAASLKGLDPAKRHTSADVNTFSRRDFCVGSAGIVLVTAAICLQAFGPDVKNLM